MFVAYRTARLLCALMVGIVWGGSVYGFPVKEQNTPILLYHHVNVLPAHMSKAMRRWSLSPQKFEAQMDWVAAHGFHTITMEQLIRHLKHGLALPPKPIVLSFDDGWKDHYSVVFPILKKHDFVGTFFIITDSVGHSAFMNWKQILRMSAAGMDIQAHTLTHPRLSTLPHEEAQHEIVESKRILEKHLNKPVTVLAYPYGCYNDDVIAIAKAAGFEGAATVSGLNGGYLFRADQSYTLERYAIEGGDNLEYIAHIKGFDSKWYEPPPRALFVSVIQDPPVLSSLDQIIKLIDFAKQARIKILFVQIYHAGQAWFPSKIAEDSPYEKCRKTVLEDPFALLIQKAHAQGIQVHAWLNLLSLGNNTNANFLKKYGTDILTRNLKGKNKLEDFKIDGQYFLEPGDPRVRDDLAKMVEEILRTYPDLDGIQFDYIRYPDVNPHYGYTKINVERFKKTYGLKTIDESSQIWKDWKRAQVTELLTRLVKIVRSRRLNMQVSTTGCMPYARAYYEAYQDWSSWLLQELVDFVTAMDYSVDLKEFERWITAIKEKTTDFSKVKIAIGAYKLARSPEIFEQEFRSCEKMGTTCAVFHYGSVLESPAFEMFLTNQRLTPYVDKIKE